MSPLFLIHRCKRFVEFILKIYGISRYGAFQTALFHGDIDKGHEFSGLLFSECDFHGSLLYDMVEIVELPTACLDVIMLFNFCWTVPPDE